MLVVDSPFETHSHSPRRFLTGDLIRGPARAKTAFTLIVLGFFLVGCAVNQPQPKSRPPASPTASPGACPSPNWTATKQVRDVNLTPELGPKAELGSQADLIWTFPDPQTEGGRIMGVELFVGRASPLMNSPFDGEAVKVRGFGAKLGSIEGGLALQWTEGAGRCGQYALTSYGLSDEELLSFANGLAETRPQSMAVVVGRLQKRQ